MTPIIELKNITFVYPATSRIILKNVNFSLKPGQRVGLVGPNGSGKTSMFHVIMGILKPQKGTILFKGEEVNDKEDFRKLHKTVGLLFQDADDQLFSPTVLEDVAFGPLNLGATPKEAREIAVTTLKELGLEGFENRITHQLSGGEKKLVSLATILAMKPEALLLDEPTNNLDIETRARLIDVLNRLDQALLIISHDWDLLEDTCNDIFAMDKGVLTECDKAYLHEHRHAHRCGRIEHRHIHKIIPVVNVDPRVGQPVH